MKKTYKIEVDCANCANKIETAVNKVEGVKVAAINFMALKMSVEFEEGAVVENVLKEIIKVGKKTDSDFELIV